MKVQYIAFSFVRGGAAIAARSMIRAVSSHVYVRAICVEPYEDEGVECHAPRKLAFLIHLGWRLLEYILISLLLGRSITKQSLNIFSSRHVLRYMHSGEKNGFISHVHWINNCTLSIFALRRLPRNSVVSLHDEWLYIGSGTYEIADNERKHILRSIVERWLMDVKLRNLAGRDDITFTVPSRWMLERACSSSVLSGKNVVLLPNIVDPEEFSLIGISESQVLKKEWEIPGESVVIGFGAVDGTGNRLKGFSQLKEALVRVSDQLESERSIVLLAFGAGTEGLSEIAGFPVVGLGHVGDRGELNKVYRSCDFVVVPSLREAFGLTAAEALLSGSPIVSFEGTGVEDLVEHGRSGFLAKHGDSRSLADCIMDMLALDKVKRDMMGLAGRSSIENYCSPEVVVRRLVDIYEEARCAL